MTFQYLKLKLTWQISAVIQADTQYTQINQEAGVILHALSDQLYPGGVQSLDHEIWYILYGFVFTCERTILHSLW